jgi:hypothetical protein
MNFAEYIAVLSGDTNLLEKAKLEKRIMQLKSEETVFLKSMRGRTIEITTIREEIKRNNTILARLKEDLNRFEILPRDADGKVIFKATVQDVAYTDPKLAGEALNIAVDTENKDTVNYQEIGSFHGFKLVIRAEQSLNALGTENFQNKIFVAGDLKYSYNNGHLARTPSLAGEYAVNALNRIPGIIDQHEKTGQTNNEKLNALLALEGMTWPKAMELKSAESSLREISAKIERSLQTKSKGTDMSIG